MIGTTKISVGVKAVICDSPARALVKGTVYFNHSHGCQKCTEVGKFSKISNTMTFPQMQSPPRTDDGFRARNDPAHHHTVSPFVDLPIDMVQDFPVCDALHLLHVGLMKRFLISWQTGNYGFATKWSSRDERELSEYLITCKTPTEVHRGMRSLKDLPRWKATEYRTFLLYISIVALKKHLPEFYYNHFLLFYCSIVILNSEFLVKHLLPLTDNMIKSFLEIFKNKYGKQHFTSNLHNLSHIVDEVKRFGPLANFDSYKFENKLQDIKKMIRSGKLHLIQIRNRITERRILEQRNIQKFAIRDKISLSGPKSHTVSSMQIQRQHENFCQNGKLCLRSACRMRTGQR